MYRFLIFISLFISVSAFAQTMDKANYALAARFSPKRLEKMIFSTSVDPHWMKNSDQFWYMYETTSGKIPQQEFTYLEVEPGQGVYAWIDYNNNTIQELQEFELVCGNVRVGP